MATDDKIKGWKLQFAVNKKAAKILALSSGKIDKYKYLTGKLLSSNPGLITEQTKFTYHPLRIVFEKQRKRIKSQIKKQFETLKVLKLMNNSNKKESIEDIFTKDQEDNSI